MKKGAVGSRKNEAAIKSLAIRIKTLGIRAGWFDSHWALGQA